MTAAGDGWSVAVQARRGVPVPMRASFGSEGPYGRADVAVRGRGRATRVHVRAFGQTLTGWLGEGTTPASSASGG